MAIGYWLRHPGQLWPRIRYWWWERRNPDKPWLTPGAVAFLDTHLTTGMVGLEFGSGRSTAWFAQKLGRLVSVEHHAEWFKVVREQLARAGVTNVDYRMVPLEHPESAPEQDSYSPRPKYVGVADDFADDSLDFVVVDGHYRTNCVLAVLAKLKPGGLLLVDDANMWPGCRPPVPVGWRELSRTTNGLKFTVIWEKPRDARPPLGGP